MAINAIKKFYSSVFGICIFILLNLIIFSGCNSSGGGDPETETETESESESVSGAEPTLGLNLLYDQDVYNIDAIEGTDDLLVLVYTEASNNGTNFGFRSILNVYQQDPVNPDNLLILDSVYLGVDTLYQRTSDINMNNEWITVTINHNTHDEGWIALVSCDSGDDYTLDLLINIQSTIDRAAANGKWLLSSYDNALVLYDITDKGDPEIKQTFDFDPIITKILSVNDGYFIFTEDGYSYLNLINENNIELVTYTDLDIKAARKAYLVDSNIYMGGPSQYVGKSKIAKINILDPQNPVIELIKDDVEGEFKDFAFDISDSYYIITDEGISKYIEGVSGFQLDYLTSFDIYEDSRNSKFFSINDYLYVHYSGMSVYEYGVLQGVDDNSELLPSLELINDTDIYNVKGIGGAGEIVALVYVDSSGSGYPNTLNIYQQDSVNNDELINLDSVFLGISTLYKRTSDINVNDEWVAVTINYNLDYEGWIALVSLASYGSYSLDMLLYIPAIVERSAANGDWLLTSYDNALVLYDITDRDVPEIKRSFDFDSIITTILSVNDGFFIFTEEGYSYLDFSNEDNIELYAYIDLDIKAARKAYLVGSYMYIGGPSQYVCKSKIGKINISDPFNPEIVIMKDDIDGEFKDFAFDINNSYYVITEYGVSKYMENIFDIQKEYTALIDINSNTRNSQMHSINDRLYTTNSGISVWDGDIQ